MSLRSTLFLISLMVVFAMWSYVENTKYGGPLHSYANQISKAPPCVQLYDYLDEYSKKYGVPFDIALGVAEHETGYRGPFHWSYDPKQTSTANAHGAMQVQVPTAQFVMGKKVTKSDLLNDLRLNVEISMKYLSQLRKRYGSWAVALGYYNSGHPIVNGYAQDIINKK